MTQKTKDDGGPAFPPHGEAFEYIGVETGMTLRDWFAGNMDIPEHEFPNIETAAAFVGCSPPPLNDTEGVIILVARVQAKIRYMQADAMLAERDKS